MTRLVLKSWLLLVYLDGLMAFRSFRALRETLSRYPTKVSFHRRYRPEQLCHAIDVACVLYLKPVLCLQRSAATALLLRSHGWEAQLIVGAQIMPPAFHAWVEIEGAVINDKSYIRTLYQTLDAY